MSAPSGWYAAGTRDGPLSIAAFTGGLGALEERKELRTTHGRVWYGAQLMIQYLDEAQRVLGLDRADLKVLELGSGTGWLGLNLAAQLPNAGVTLTDLDRAVPEIAAHVGRAVGPRHRDRPPLFPRGSRGALQGLRGPRRLR